MSREELIQYLTEIYDYKIEEIQKLTEVQLIELLNQKQKEKLAKKQNPNKWMILKDLPPPKVYKTKTSSKVGIVIFVIFILMFVFFGVISFLIASKRI